MFCVKNGTKKKNPNLRASCVRCCLSVCRSSSRSSCVNLQMALGFQFLSLPAGLSHLRGLGSGDTRSWRIVGCIFPILLQARLHVVTVLVITEATSSVGTLAMLPCHCWPSKCSVSLNPVLCFEMSSFIKLTQLKVSASSLSLSSTMIVPEPSPG